MVDGKSEEVKAILDVMVGVFDEIVVFCLI